MILLMVATSIGGAVTVAVLWPFGALTALLSAPFGGSFLALVAGLSLAILRTRVERKQERSTASFRIGQKEAA
jgi:membrane protein implicated in regulation of membrane protease activity